MQVGCVGFANEFNFISVLSETVFAHIVPISNENENERRNLDERRVGYRTRVRKAY
jgi:hypothetical protein